MIDWISVEERLPTEEQCIENNSFLVNMEKNICFAQFRNDFWLYCLKANGDPLYVIKNGIITHWAEINEPEKNK